jgi:hypothetical protein
MEILS